MSQCRSRDVMAEQRVDGFDATGDPSKVLGSTPSGIGSPSDGFVAGQFGGAGGGVTTQKFTMRAWSASLSEYVTWVATILDTAGSQAPAGAGVLTDIVWLRSV